MPTDDPREAENTKQAEVLLAAIAEVAATYRPRSAAMVKAAGSIAASAAVQAGATRKEYLAYCAEAYDAMIKDSREHGYPLPRDARAEAT